MMRFFQISFWLLVFAGITVILGFARQEQKNIVCSGLRIVIPDADTPGFVTEADLRRIITHHHDSIPGLYLDSVHSEQLENLLKSNPYISGADVVKSLLGEVIIEAHRNRALARVITSGGESFYLSEAGTVMPVSTKYTPRAIVASGAIDLPASKIRQLQEEKSSLHNHPLLSQTHYLAGRLKQHPFLNAYVEQIFINQKQEFELIPADGGHIIVLGDLSNLEIKIENLLAFYQAAKPRMSEKAYREINLKYINQVVCKK
ncbi:MAG: cell division protein FtsQ/DivIB [Bacteroidales bacterium]